MAGIQLDFATCQNERVDAALKACVREAVEAVVSSVGEADLEAVVLAGTLARGEATATIRADQSLLAWSDAELLAVCSSRAAQKRAWPLLPQRFRELEEAFQRRGILLHVDGRPTRRAELKRLRPRIFTLELHTHGKVLWGDPEALRCVPAVSPQQLPRWDALMLLFNRLIEHLDARRTITTASPDELLQIQYKNVKTVLDLAGSLLAFNGAYEPSYRARAERFPALFCTLKPLSERLPELPEQVRRWTEFKLNGEESALWGGARPEDPARHVREQWQRTAQAVREVWLWESNRFLGGRPTDDPFEIASKYLRNDMIGIKLKGWIQLLLSPRGRREVTLARALRLLSLARPNVLIYVAGAILYFALSSSKGRELAERLEEAAAAADRFLPAPAQDWEEPREVLAAVIRNWEWFVK